MPNRAGTTALMETGAFISHTKGSKVGGKKCRAPRRRLHLAIGENWVHSKAPQPSFIFPYKADASSLGGGGAKYIPNTYTGNN